MIINAAPAGIALARPCSGAPYRALKTRATNKPACRRRRSGITYILYGGIFIVSLALLEPGGLIELRTAASSPA